MSNIQLKTGFGIYLADVFFKQSLKKTYTRIAAVNEDDARTKVLDVYNREGDVKKVILNLARKQHFVANPESVIGIQQAVQ